MRALNLNQTADMLRFAAGRIIDKQTVLGDLDARIGDGDHGATMALGMRRACEALDRLEAPTTVGDLFRCFGRAMLMSMGGASGVVFGTMFQGGASALGESDALDAEGLRRLFRASLEAVKRRGGAKPGDKSMVDAFEPAVCAMERCGSEDLCLLLKAASLAAAQGAADTGSMQARVGRARSLGQRSLGVQDPGATSVSILFEAMSDYADTQTAVRGESNE